MRKPARKINNGGKNRVIGNFPSYKMGRSVEWDSQIERDFLFYLEFDDDVVEYFSQPIKYRYTLNDKYQTHYPDFEIKRKSTDRLKFVEIKSVSTTQKPEFIEKTAAIRASMSRDGYDYAVVTDADLRVDPLFSNLKLLYRYIWVDVDPVKLKALIRDIASNHDDAVTLTELRDIAAEHALDLNDCYSCIAKKFFLFDLSSRLTPETPLKLAEV